MESLIAIKRKSESIYGENGFWGELFVVLGSIDEFWRGKNMSPRQVTLCHAIIGIVGGQCRQSPIIPDVLPCTASLAIHMVHYLGSLYLLIIFLYLESRDVHALKIRSRSTPAL